MISPNGRCSVAGRDQGGEGADDSCGCCFGAVEVVEDTEALFSVVVVICAHSQPVQSHRKCLSNTSQLSRTFAFVSAIFTSIGLARVESQVPPGKVKPIFISWLEGF